jgi:hypothetical protein
MNPEVREVKQRNARERYAMNPEVREMHRRNARERWSRPEVKEMRFAWRAKRQADRLAELMAWLRENGSITQPFTRGSCMEIAVKIFNATKIPSGSDRTLRSDQTLREAFSDPEFACYIGETGRTLQEEDCGWLSKRGSPSIRGTNNPVLKWKSEQPGTTGKIITRTEAFNQLGFRSMVVFQHANVTNCLLVEAALQTLCHDTGIGRRLHRVVGAGMRYMPFGPMPDGSPRLHKVFITYSHDVARHLRDDKIELHPYR